MKRPLSMTAFGRGEDTSAGRTWTAEIRSVNHRYLDIKIRVARKYNVLEDRIRQVIAAQYSRGHIDVTIETGGDTTAGIHLSANLALARQYHQCLESIRQDLSLSTPPALGMFCGAKDVISAVEDEEDMEEVWKSISRALNAALKEGLSMRHREAKMLKKDLLARLQAFEKTLKTIEQIIPQLVSDKKAALQERLEKLLDKVELDPVRLAQEVALIADRSDVTEEMVRLHSHIDQCRNFLDLNEPTGRRLDFLMQEFLREINTMASKISSADIAHQAIELKNEIEKMREQVQNLE